MGSGCSICKEEVETNPDGSDKEPQTQEQVAQDPIDLRKAAKDCEKAELEKLLRRMGTKAISSGAKKTESASPDDEGNTALHYAAAANNKPCLELLILYRAAVNARNSAGRTPLHAALDAGKRQAAHLLLEHGADINARDKGGVSPFMVVLAGGRKRLATWLLQRCGDALDLDALDKQGTGAQLLAARNGWWEVLEATAKGAKTPEMVLNTRSKGGDTPLGWLLKYGASGLVDGQQLGALVGALVEKGASPLVPVFEEQIPPLCLAAATGHWGLVQALRDRGAALEPCADSVKRTPLHYAAAKGHVAVCSELVSAGLKPYAPDAGGNTPLHMAALRGHADAARLLLERSEEPTKALTAVNRTGLTPFHLFLSSGPEERAQQGVTWVLQKLGAEEAKAPVQDKKQRDTPLLLAIGSHQDKVVEALLAAGHDPNQANLRGETPLARCLACAVAETASRDGAIFKALVERGAGLEGASAACHPLLALCKTPLSGLSERAVAVLAAKAGGALDWSLRDEAGRGPLHLAAAHDNAYMTRYLLEQAKVPVDEPCAEGRTPLMYAAWGCAPNAMKILLNRRADPRVTDPSGASPLSYCLRLDRLESLSCAAMLLMMGAAAESVVDGLGEGLLHRAVRYGAPKFIDLWVRYGGDVTLLATTADDANDLPESIQAAGLGDAAAPASADASDYIDSAPTPLEMEEEGDDGNWDIGSGKLDGPEDGIGSKSLISRSGSNAISDGRRSGSGSFRIKAGQASPAAGAGAGSLGRLAGADAAGFRAATGPSPALSRRATGDGALSAAPLPGIVMPGGSGGRRLTGDGGSSSGSGARAALGRTPSGGVPNATVIAGSLSGNRRLTGDGVAGLTGSRPHRASGTGSGFGALSKQGSLVALPHQMSNGRRTSRSSGSGGFGGPIAEGLEEEEQLPLEWFSGAGLAAGREGADGDEPAARYPSFCRRPSFVQVRRWARQGHEWFDAALPDAGSDAASEALPLPPGDDEELIEEALNDWQAAPDLHPALDADAIWRSMMLETIKDRRGVKAGAGAGAGPVAEGTQEAGGGGGREAAVRCLEGWEAEVERLTARLLQAQAQPRAAHRRRGPGPVAEADEGGGGGGDSCGSGDDNDVDSSDGEGGGGGDGGEDGGDDGAGGLEGALSGLKGAGMSLGSKLLDKRVPITDPYYMKGSKYQGLPKYMDERAVPLQPASREELLGLAGQLRARMAGYRQPQEEAQLQGADLRERNIRWYNTSLSPSEYPMKLGQWRAAAKKEKAAAAAARARKPRAPGQKPVVRSRKAWFGLPAMPSRPELRATSALVYAVRLGRPACVAALLRASLAPLNRPDGWGHTPLAYACYMLARDRGSALKQQLVDMLLEKLPQVNYTWLDQADGNVGHSLMCPINLAVITNDAPRLCHMVLRCGGAINNAWTLLPDVPTYLAGTWEKVAGRCESRVPPLALAVLTKRLDMVKLVLDLGANPNLTGDARDLKLKAKLKAQHDADVEARRQLASEYNGLLKKAKLGMMQKLARLKRAISNIEIPGITRPHPFLSPLHLAARTGQAPACFLLLRRGALPNGASASACARKSPLQEALEYARTNFRASNAAARRRNWKAVRPSLEDVPPMSPEALKAEADSKGMAMMRAMIDPTVIAVKAVAAAAKFAVNLLLEMRKRPIAHHDPALAAAHVLLAFRSPYDVTDTQTAIVLRDLMDNGKWRWLRRTPAARLRVRDPEWVEAANGDIKTLKEDPDCGYEAISSTKDPKEYRTLKAQFLSKSDEAYFGSGAKAMHARYSACSQALWGAQREYVAGELAKQLEEQACQAVTANVEGVREQLERYTAARRQLLEGTAASLEAGYKLDESDAMAPPVMRTFEVPETSPAAPQPRQAAAAGELCAAAAAAAAAEGWPRVMVWAADGRLAALDLEGGDGMPGSAAELAALGKKVANFDTDELQESMDNLMDSVGETVDSLLSSLQEAQEGLASLLDLIGIDILDAL